jgi:hypothetical protein
MRSLKYESGEEVSTGDRILYHGERGHVEAVVLEKGGEHSWYLEQSSGGGMAISAEGMGAVFIPADFVAGDEDLEFVARE